MMVASTRGGVRLCPRKTAKFSGSPSTVNVLSSTSSSIAMVDKNNLFFKKISELLCCSCPHELWEGTGRGKERGVHFRRLIITRHNHNFDKISWICPHHHTPLLLPKIHNLVLLLFYLISRFWPHIIIRHYNCQTCTMLTKFHKFYLISQCWQYFSSLTWFLVYQTPLPLQGIHDIDNISQVKV